MRRVYWESFTFGVGINTHHAWSEGGEIYARDMQNLGVDENAHLRQRWRSEDVLSQSVDVAATGIAIGGDYHFVIQDGGKLYAFDVELDRLEIEGAEGLSGRLWMIDRWRDFIIGKSDGAEGGFWVDTTEETLTARSLGLDPPSFPASARFLDSAADVALLNSTAYVYRFTHARVFGSEENDFQSIVSGDEFTQEGVLFGGMESNPSVPGVFVFANPASNNIKTFETASGEEIEPVRINEATHNHIEFNDLVHSDDPQVTGMFLYQSEPVPAYRGDTGFTVNVDSLEYRRVRYVPKGETSITPGIRATDGDEVSAGRGRWADQVVMRIDNHRLPDKPAQITYYNDLVFAAVGDELRYSDVRDGAPVQWAFPEANSIRVEGDVTFCVEFRGVLLFGGDQGMWRLTGVDEYSFDVDRISGVGPVSGSAWAVFETGVGFIAQDGLYITDGVQVVKASTPALDGYFEGNRAVSGAVSLLPGNDELYAVRFATGARFQFHKSSRGGFFRWLGSHAHQYVSLKDDSVMFVDGEQRVQRIDFFGGLDAEMAWFWFSNEIDFKEDGIGEALKVFKWLEISGSHEGEGLVQTIVDGVSDTELRAVTFRGDTQRPVRVPINRRGERIQFRVSGVGTVGIRYFRLMAEVRSARSRF